MKKTISNLTDEEKEELYQEFKSRMENEKCTPNRTMCMAENKAYMDDLYSTFNNEMKIQYPSVYKEHNSSFSNKDPLNMHKLTLQNTINWDRIRLLVCRIFGVSSPRDLPEEYIEEANNIARHIIDYTFEKNTAYVNEVYHELEKLKYQSLDGRYITY